MNGSPSDGYLQTEQQQQQLYDQQTYSPRTRNGHRDTSTATVNNVNNNKNSSKDSKYDLTLRNTISQGMQWLVQTTIHITSTWIVWMVNFTSYVLTRLPQDLQSLYQSAKRIIHLVCKWSFRSLVVYMGLCAAALLYVMLLCVCLCVALITVAQFRRYKLSHVDGSRVLPVPFNSLPLITQWWRQSPIDQSIEFYLYKSDQYHDHKTYAQHLLSPHSHFNKSPHLSQQQQQQQQQQYHGQHLSQLNRQKEQSQVTERQNHPQRYLAKRRPYRLPHDTYRNTMTTFNAFDLIAHHAKDIKLSLLQQYTQSLLATATLLLPSHSTSQDIFLPDGQINTRALFATGPPLFNAWGEYNAQVQLIFSKTTQPVERDVSVVLQSSMLFVDEESSSGGLLSSAMDRGSSSTNNMDVLFTTTHTGSLHLTPINEQEHRRRLSHVHSFFVVRWIHEWVHLCKQTLRVFFIVPIKTYEVFHHYLRHSSQMVFPLIDEQKQIALTLPVYNHFTPPISLQSRLRAMNFTCYYVIHEQTEMNALWQTTTPNSKHYSNNFIPGSGSSNKEIKSSSPLQLRRILLHSSLRLHGLARFFMMYPIFSFIVCTIVCFATCVAVMNLMLAGLALFVYVKFIRKRQSNKQHHNKRNKRKASRHHSNRRNSKNDSDSNTYNDSTSLSSSGGSSISDSSSNNDSSWSDVTLANKNNDDDDSFDTSENASSSIRKKKTTQKRRKQKKDKRIAHFLLSHTDSFPHATSYTQSTSSSSRNTPSFSPSSSSSSSQTRSETRIPIDDTTLSIGQHAQNNIGTSKTNETKQNITIKSNNNDDHVHTKNDKEQQQQQQQLQQHVNEMREDSSGTQSIFLSAKQLTTPLSPPSPSPLLSTETKPQQQHKQQQQSKPHKLQQTEVNTASTVTAVHTADNEDQGEPNEKKKKDKVKGDDNSNNKNHNSSSSSSSSSDNMYGKVQ